MVKLLPSDVARLVLAYLKGHNLKNASQKFLEESPDLEEVRQNPECPLLPPLAKDLETILEEHATFIQDGKKRTEVNPVVIQLWRKLDAVVAQLKYEYLQETLPPPQMKGVNNYLQNQRGELSLMLFDITPRKKYSPEDLIPMRSTTSQDSSAQAPLLYPEELMEFPQILESLLSDQTLPEKLAGTINKVLPNTEFSFHSAKTTEEPTSSTASSSLRVMDEGSVMDRRALEEVIEMASSDPAFDSLFSLFNVEREKFLEEEKKRLVAQTLWDNSRDPSRNVGNSVNRESMCVPRQLFPGELREKETDPSQKDVNQFTDKHTEGSNERQAEVINERQAEMSNNRQVENGNEKLNCKGEGREGKESVKEDNIQRKDEVSSDGEVEGGSDDEVVDMETQNISTSPLRQEEKVKADSSFVDVETAERSTPSPSKVTSLQPEKGTDVKVLDQTNPEGHDSEEEIDVTKLEKSGPDEGDMSEKNAAQRLSSMTPEKSPQSRVASEGSYTSHSQIEAQKKEEVDGTQLEKPDHMEGQLSEEEIDVTEPDRSELLKGDVTTAQRLSSAAQEECLQSKRGSEESNTSHSQIEAQKKEEVDGTQLEKPDHMEGQLSEEEIDVTEPDRSELLKGDVTTAQRLSSAAQEECQQSKKGSEGSNTSHSQIEAQKKEEVDGTQLEKPDHMEGQLSEEEIDVTEPDRSEVLKGDVTTAQRLSSAAQEECQQSKKGSEGSNTSQNQTAAEKEQKDEAASTSNKGKRVRRRRDRTNFSQGTRRSLRLEAKQKENSIPEGSPHSNQGEGGETPIVSPAKSKIPLTESDLMDRAKSQNLEAANEYAKKVLASMAHGTSSDSLSSDSPQPITRNVAGPTGDNQSLSSSNLHGQSGVPLVVTSSGGKKCKTVASLTNTTATVLSTRQNAEITTTKSCASKGKVTVMAPPSAAYDGNRPHGGKEKDTSCVEIETGSGKSEKKISECVQSQSIAGSSVDADVRTANIGSIEMVPGSAPPSRVQVTYNSSSPEANVNVSSSATGLTDSGGSINHATQQNAVSTLTSPQGAIRTAYMPPATCVNSITSAYSTSQNLQAHHHTTSPASYDAIHATQNMQGLQFATGLASSMQNLSRNQFMPASATQNMQTQQHAVSLAANIPYASSVQYIPASVQVRENPPTNMQAASDTSVGNISREQYGPGSSTSYSIAGAQASTLPLLVYNPAALQGTNIVPGSMNLQNNSVNPGNVVYYSVENNNNRTFQLLQPIPGTSGIVENPQVITLQAADGLLSLSGGAHNTLPSREIGQTTAIPQKASASKEKRKSCKKKKNQSKQKSAKVNHSDVSESQNVRFAAPLHSSNSLPSAEDHANLYSTTVLHYDSVIAKSSVTQEVQKRSSGLDGSDAVPQSSNHLNLDNQGVATLINDELERSLENASTQDIDFIFKAITMTPQKESVSSDCAKYSPLDKAVADKLKQFAVGLSNRGFSTEVQKERPSPLKKAAMQMQGEMLRNKKCVRKVFSDEGSFDECLLKDTGMQPAERTANVTNVTENGNKTKEHSGHPTKYVLESNQIMNGFVPTSTLPTSHERSNAMPTSLPDPLGPGGQIPSSENETSRMKSESYSKQLEGHKVQQDRSNARAGERQHRSHQNGMDHSFQSASVGLQENATVTKCNKDKTQNMGERLKQNNFKYRIDVDKKQKLEKRMRTRLKQENLEIKRDRGLERKDKRDHNETNLRTSENAGTSNSHGGEGDAGQFINDHNERVVRGGKGYSEGRGVERPAHGGGMSGGMNIGDKSGDRVTHTCEKRRGFENMRDDHLKKRTSSDGIKPIVHDRLSNVRDGENSTLSERTSREGDNCGDNLWSKIEKVINDRKWVEGEKESQEKNSSTKVGGMREQTDSSQQEESCSRTEGYKRTLKRGTPESRMRLDLSGGKVCDNERGHVMGKEGRRKELPDEEKVTDNENIQNMRVREYEGSKSVVYRERKNIGPLGGNCLTDGNLYDSGRSRNLEEGRKDTRSCEQLYDLRVGGSKSCSTPKENLEDMAVSGHVGTAYSSSTTVKVKGGSPQNVRGKGFVENETFIEKLDQGDKVLAQRFQNENERRIREVHEDPDVSPILADEDISSQEEDDSLSLNEEIDSCSRTRVHYSKTNSKWNKPRAESTWVSMSTEGETAGPKYPTSHSLVNRSVPISSTQSNSQTHSVDDRVKKFTTLMNRHSNYSEPDSQSSLGRFQASGIEGSGGTLAAGPSRIGIPGPSSGTEGKTKKKSITAKKRPSEQDKEPNQEKKKRIKKKSRSNDEFPSDFDLQKFFAKLKYV
ncbi:Protein NPAT [Holothuria leucospilota]|uniref:Protein NPAT n=1 Tax=Holothuria leucospilota TaxID=206669 RepID=A0A9Q1BJH0_HOLLE|nr:Protein NPAT [Holothuria leucospilota]